MSIRRPRGPKPALQHLAFFEAMTELPELSAESRALRAGLLTLRLFDEWMSSGALVTEGASPVILATRAAVDAAHEDPELQLALMRIVAGILMLREPDANAVLPRLAALADLYSQRGETALAEDVQSLVTRYAQGVNVRSSAPTEAMA